MAIKEVIPEKDDEKCDGSVTPSNDGVQRRDYLSSPKDVTLCDLMQLHHRKSRVNLLRTKGLLIV